VALVASLLLRSFHSTLLRTLTGRRPPRRNNARPRNPGVCPPANLDAHVPWADPDGREERGYGGQQLRLGLHAGHPHHVHVPLVVLAPAAAGGALVPERPRGGRGARGEGRGARGALCGGRGRAAVGLGGGAPRQAGACALSRAARRDDAAWRAARNAHVTPTLRGRPRTPHIPPLQKAAHLQHCPMVHHFAGIGRARLFDSTRRASEGVISGRSATRRPPLSWEGGQRGDGSGAVVLGRAGPGASGRAIGLGRGRRRREGCARCALA
jgi:hypothetical protein